MAMQRAEERNAYIDAQYEQFCDAYIKEALLAIEQETLMGDNTDPAQAAFEHLEEKDVHKLMQCVLVAYKHLPDDAPQVLRNALLIARDHVLFAVEDAAKIEADYLAGRGYFSPEDQF